jgi:hypothetical protein
VTLDTPIFEADLKLVGSGLFPGLSDLAVPLWKSATAMDFGGFGAATCKGNTLLDYDVFLFDSASGNFDSASGLFDELSGAAPIVPPSNKEVVGVTSVIRSTGTKLVVFGTRDKLYGFDGSTVDTSSTTFTGVKDSAGTTRATKWSMITVGDWIIASNGIEAAKIRTAGTWVDLGGTTFTYAELLAKYGPYVIAINTSNGKKLIEWCSDDSVTTWTPAAGNTAGNLLLRDLVSDPVAAAPLANFLAIYSENQLIRLVYRPNAFIFGTDGPPVSGCGAVSKASIVDANGVHYGLLKQGIFKTDGFSVSWVDYPAFGTWLEQNINWDQRAKITGFHAIDVKQIRWSVPLVGSVDNNGEIVYNYATNSISRGPSAYYSSFPKDTFQYPLLGSNAGAVLYAQYGASLRGSSVSRVLQTKPLDCGIRTQWKYVDYVESEINIEEGNGPTIEIGWQKTLADAITWTTAETVVDEQHRAYARVSGVFISLRYTSSNANDRWTLTGFKIFGTRDGGTI